MCLPFCAKPYNLLAFNVQFLSEFCGIHSGMPKHAQVNPTSHQIVGYPFEPITNNKAFSEKQTCLINSS